MLGPMIVDCYVAGGGKTYTMVGQPVSKSFAHFLLHFCSTDLTL